MAPDYRLASGDEVEIEVVLPKAVEAETTNPFREGRRFIVAPGGRLSVPTVKDVELFGRTIAEVQRDIEERLRAAGVATSPDVFVRVTAYAPRFVHLVKAVFKTIEISPFGRANLLTVLAQAGDALKDVDVESIAVISLTGPTRTVNFRSVLAAGGKTADAYLDPGDILILEKAVKVEKAKPVVYIAGFVKAPGAYELEEPGRSGQPLTVTRLVYIAGGVTELGNLKKVTIRRSRGQPEWQVVNFYEIMTNQRPDVPLLADDMVYVND
jgi:protein involved in polysaccharide export with SLBB domain